MADGPSPEPGAPEPGAPESGTPESGTANAVDRAAVEAFLYREARLLDDGRYEDWLALFDEDGLYWIPGLPGQTDRFGAVSIVHEDRTVLRMRVRRLGHPRAWSLMPLPRSSHLLGNIGVAAAADGTSRRSPRSRSPCTGPATARATTAARPCGCLRPGSRSPGGGDFRIVLKRIDLIDCDGVQGVMPVPI